MTRPRAAHGRPLSDPEHDAGPGRTAYRGPVNWLLRSRQTGHLVVAQWPNLPIVGWAAASLGSRFVPAGSTGEVALRTAAGLALTWWALEELVRGVNPWRRLLGAGALVWVVTGLTGLR